MSSSFFKSFYYLILFIIIFSILIITFFIPALSQNSNYTFIYEKPNISSMYSNTNSGSNSNTTSNSIVMNSDSGFLWPTPRI